MTDWLASTLASLLLAVLASTSSCSSPSTSAVTPLLEARVMLSSGND